MSNIQQSSLSFINFKVDKLDLITKPDLSIVRLTSLESNQWSHNIGIKAPLYYQKTSEYVGGIDLAMAYFEKDEKTKTSENALIELHISISGIFKTDSKFEPSVEQKLIKTNIPFILLPHLRAAIMTLFATSGYGTVTLPLINVIAMAEKNLENINIRVVE